MFGGRRPDFATVLFLLQSSNFVRGFVPTRKYYKEKVPAGDFTVTDSFQNVASHVQCQVRAESAGKFFFRHSLSQQTCEVGTADFANVGSGAEEIFARDVPFVGMILGNFSGLPSFEIVLPGGGSCPDTGLPDFSVAGFAMTHSHSLTEQNGVIYKLAGVDENGGSPLLRSALHKLDLNDASPSWSHVSYVDGSGNGYQANGGLVGYTDSRGDTKLFALKMWICNLNYASLFVYDVGSNSWGRSGAIKKREAATMVGDGRWLYIVGGLKCGSGGNSDTVQVLDMESPSDDFVALKEGLSAPHRLVSCGVVQLGDERGLVCTAGVGDGDVLGSAVMFLPLENGHSAGPCRVLTQPLPEARNRNSFLFSFGNSDAVLVGGGPNMADNLKTALVWDPEAEAFEDRGMEIDMVPDSTGFSLISSSLVWKKCWKHMGA